MIEFKMRLNDDGTMEIDPIPLSAYGWCQQHNKGVVIAMRDGGSAVGITTSFEDWLTWTDGSGCTFGMSPAIAELKSDQPQSVEAWAREQCNRGIKSGDAVQVRLNLCDDGTVTILDLDQMDSWCMTHNKDLTVKLATRETHRPN